MYERLAKEKSLTATHEACPANFLLLHTDVTKSKILCK